MSETDKIKNQTSRMGPMGHGGPTLGKPVEKAKDFGGTLKRLLRYFLPEKILLTIVLIAAIFGTVFSIVGPKILGLATTRLFNNLIASFIVQVKNNVIKKELLQNPMLQLHLSPVPGVEFGYIGRIMLILLVFIL
jgi:ATP-binding cassette, subfamily B, multidrug efflux pump